MAIEVYKLAILIVAGVSFARFGAIIVGIIRGFRNYRRASVTHWGLVELVTWPEMFVLMGVTLYLFVNRTTPSNVAGLTLFAAIVGVALALVAMVVSAWAFVSIPTVSTGHYVLNAQPVAQKGPYRWVRHPIYLGVFLIWLALALAFGSVLTFLLAALYVFPAYILYMRSEEQMMAASYGAEYTSYCRKTGMLLPRLRGGAA
ncbi:MAG: isoprenylcysteine carboxylmethyltransferase family protein [Candidatus Binatus sp.]|uniref:methyltransferase family protein n=1 Tax=Candidatus Binatus sp. TaxID=2811406 RepID=UPI003C778501